MISAACSVDNLDDETACPRCVKTTDCNNDCGECELCPGKTVDDLPDSCTPPPPDGGTYDGGTGGVRAWCSSTSTGVRPVKSRSPVSSQ